jgi:hypothetical protein
MARPYLDGGFLSKWQFNQFIHIIIVIQLKEPVSQKNSSKEHYIQ